MEQSMAVERTELLERDRELEQLHVALGDAARKAGRTLVIDGAAGMGKSRLLDEARARGEGLGMRVLTARATDFEQGFPFGVIRQLFERLLVEADAPERSRWLAGAAALAEGLVLVPPGAAGAGSTSEPPVTDAGYAWQHGLYWLASNLCTDSLTPSERRIAEFAAAGATNREIAQTLFVTEKIVETHLGHAYRKLDISSRRQLSAMLARGEE